MELGARRIVCRGARAAEARLLAEVERWRPRTVDETAVPVRVLVPSRSLRLHVATRLAERFGSLAGVVVQTVHGAALEILARHGAVPTPGDTLFELLVRRLAGREADLAEPLSQFDDAADATLGVIRDLLDAGFEPSLAEAVIERLEDVGGGVAEQRRGRAVALIRLAARVAAGLDAVGAVRTGQAPMAAARRVATDPDRSWPCRAVLVHGFADVTGAVSELLLQMLRAWPGALILDRPPDPCDRDRDDAGVAYLGRLEVALGGLASESDPNGPFAPEVVRMTTPNRETESRVVAGRVRCLLDSGLPPEEIAIVARDPSRHVGPLRRWLERMGVPFSGHGITVPAGTVRRRVHRFVELLTAGGDAPLASWLEALEPRPRLGDLRLGLRMLGAVRVADVAALDVATLPVGGIELGFVDVDDEDPVEPPVKRVLATAEVARAVALAEGVARTVAAVGQTGTAAEHRTRVQMLMDAVGWSAGDPARGMVDDVMQGLVVELPGSLDVEPGEWRALLTGRVDAAGAQPVGGAGAGVQLLSVMEARGRTFEALLMVGLERGVFPRTASQDALLPDALRNGVADDLLPFLPVTARSAGEERYLFAQLMASARVVVCTSAARDGSEQLVASPFLDRLDTGGVGRVEAVPALWPDDRSGCWSRVRSAVEHGVTAAGEHQDRRPPEFVAAALDEGWRLAGASPPRPLDEVAVGRSDIVSQAEEPPGGPTPGPWSGIVGPVLETSGDRPWVTSLERMAACPWQSFIRNRLKVSPMPDPGGAIPDVGVQLVGQVVHRVLQRVVDQAVGTRLETLARATTREPVAVAWPAPRLLEKLTVEASRRAVMEAGLSAYGLVDLLAARCGPVLEVARGVVFGPADRLEAVLGAELDGEVEVDDPPLEVRFRADRVDRGADGLVLVDYKSGRPLSQAKQATTRRDHVLRAVRRGRLMQALAYAVAAGSGERIGTGVYLYLRPDLGSAPEEARLVELRSDDVAAVEAFLEAVAAVISARRTGAMFPRVVEADNHHDPPEHCRYCPVVAACRRDDTSFRRRLVEWMDATTAPGSAAETAARDLWHLGRGATP